MSMRQEANITSSQILGTFTLSRIALVINLVNIEKLIKLHCIKSLSVKRMTCTEHGRVEVF